MAKQERDRRGCWAEIINRRITRKRRKKKEEKMMKREGHAWGQKSGSSQPVRQGNSKSKMH